MHAFLSHYFSARRLNMPFNVLLFCVLQVLSVSPEHPAVMLSLRQVQCQRLLLSGPEPVLPEVVLEELNKAVILNPTNLGAWHVSRCDFTFKSFCSTPKNKYKTLYFW